MGKQKRYTKEFKLKATELVVHHGYTRAEAAKRLGVSQWSIGQWIKKFRNSGDLVEDEQTRHETEQVRQLRKQLKRLELENEILKKAAAYFAKESL